MEERDSKGDKSPAAIRRSKVLVLTVGAVFVFFLGTFVGSASQMSMDPANIGKVSMSARPGESDIDRRKTSEAHVDRTLTPIAQVQLPQPPSEAQPQPLPDGGVASAQQHSSSIDATIQAMEKTRRESSTYVKKTVFKEGVRFLFIAGLEGSGHHAWQTLFWSCWKEDNACHVPQALQKHLYNNKTWGLFNPIGPSRTVHKEEWMNLRDIVVQDMKNEERKVAPQCLSILNVAEYVGNVGEMSYPNYIHGPERSLRKPDLTLLANMAEEAGVDLRILVLVRDAAGIYHSTVTHRHFMPGLPQTMVLIDNAHSLFGQLMSIDPRFVRCISNYGKQPTVSTRGLELANWLHPNFAGAKAGFWRRLLTQIHTPAEVVHEPNRIDTNLIGRLKAATDLIDGYCDLLP